MGALRLQLRDEGRVAPGVLARECWLQAFAPPPMERRLRVRVRLVGARLTVRYVLEGEFDDAVLPGPQAPARRRDGLWRATCLEAFLARPDQAGYHEVNLAPEGDWACYRFEGPRAGMRPETELSALEWKTHRVPGHFAIRFTLDLSALDLDGGDLELGLCAILLRTDGQREFWALAHPGSAPDFHNRAGFLLRLS